MMLSGVLWKDNFFDIGAAYVKVIILIITKSPGRKFGSSATHTKPRAILTHCLKAKRQSCAATVCTLNMPTHNCFTDVPLFSGRRPLTVLQQPCLDETIMRSLLGSFPGISPQSCCVTMKPGAPFFALLTALFLNQAFKFVNENTNILHSVLTSLFVCYVLISLHCFSLTDAFFICFLFT